METFTCTSDAPYDQCVYLLTTEDGKVDSVWEDYEHVRDHWMIYYGRTRTQRMGAIIPVLREEWEASLAAPAKGGSGFK